MPADASAYAALGLDPGADWAAIERAYKRLIKRHHPDRAGGNTGRAAEITRAYRELRAAHSARDELVFDDEWERAGGAGNVWIRAAIAAAIAVVCLVVATGPVAALIDRLSATAAPARVQVDEPLADDPMDGPLVEAAVDAAVADASRIARGSDEISLAARSRDCHRDLRMRPSLERFDRCSAFDDAVVELQDRDPLRDQGPFSELAVTGRQMSAATLLSNDYLAIDGRLDRIRLRVELALAPAEPPLPEVNAALAD
jgi:hypothetical protein